MPDPPQSSRIGRLHVRRPNVREPSRYRRGCPSVHRAQVNLPWHQTEGPAGLTDRRSRPLESHEKTCALANIDGYIDHLFRYLDYAMNEQLSLPENRALARGSRNQTPIHNFLQ